MCQKVDQKDSIISEQSRRLQFLLPVLSNHLMFWYSFDAHALIILRTDVVGQVHMLKFVEWMVLHLKKNKKGKEKN